MGKQAQKCLFFGYLGEVNVQQLCWQNGGVHLTFFSGEHLLCLLVSWILLRMAIFVCLLLNAYLSLLFQDNPVVILETSQVRGRFCCWFWGFFLFSNPLGNLTTMT